jgi:hypothetical protein
MKQLIRGLAMADLVQQVQALVETEGVSARDEMHRIALGCGLQI